MSRPPTDEDRKNYRRILDRMQRDLDAAGIPPEGKFGLLLAQVFVIGLEEMRLSPDEVLGEVLGNVMRMVHVENTTPPPKAKA